MDTTRALALADDLPRHEAERLLSAASGLARSRIAIGAELVDDAATRFVEMVERRRRGEPLQYIEGTVTFGPLELAVDGRALIPRPETEHLWDLLVQRLSPPPGVVVDLCTGCGNLALACKHAWPEAAVHATERSPDAATLASENAATTGLEIDIWQGDLFDPLPTSLRGTVDLVVANPPYIADPDLGGLALEVRDHEPREALLAGADGTDLLARIAAVAGAWLRPGGTIACEISELHPDRVARLFSPYHGEILPDLTGRPRYVLGTQPTA